jgi:hypothetical protein
MGNKGSKLAEYDIVRRGRRVIDLIWNLVLLKLEMGDFADQVGEMVFLAVADETNNGTPVGNDFLKLGGVPGMESCPVIVQVDLVKDDPAILRGQEALDPARPPVRFPELDIELLVQEPTVLAFLEVQ